MSARPDVYELATKWPPEHAEITVGPRSGRYLAKYHSGTVHVDLRLKPETWHEGQPYLAEDP